MNTAEGQWQYYFATKVTAGLASHSPYVTDSVVYPSRKMFSIEDRGQTDRFDLDPWPWRMALTFNPRRAMVQTHTRTRTNSSSKVSRFKKITVETNGRTEGRTDRRTLLIVLTSRLTRSRAIGSSASDREMNTQPTLPLQYDIFTFYIVRKKTADDVWHVKTRQKSPAMTSRRRSDSATSNWGVSSTRGLARRRCSGSPSRTSPSPPPPATGRPASPPLSGSTRRSSGFVSFNALSIFV